MNIILLSGGSGKRLWPLSNDVRSKQFIKLFKTEDGYESMLQRVYRQILEEIPEAKITIATSKAQVAAIHNQLGPQVELCVEPERRDTYPAIALAASYLRDYKGVAPEEMVVVCPVDSYVEPEFFGALKTLTKELAQVLYKGEGIALLGIEALHPTEKYGYILPESTAAFSKIRAYKEKPSQEQAKEYLAQGALWNGGVFAFALGYLLDKVSEQLDYKGYDDLYHRYKELEKTSFDYAILEKEPAAYVLRYKGTWKDMGSWNTLTECMEEQSIGKATISESCKNVHVLNDLDVPILCMGLEDVVISTSPEGILVSDKEESIAIKPYVEELRQQVRFAEKSWGEFRVLDIEKESLTIKITLNPGHSMNYHSHKHRNEVWTVIEGQGRTLVDGMEQPVNVGDVITMQAGCKHTVIADTRLKLIEVQLGRDISVSDKQKFEVED